ncbi:MAG: SRPBCC domain-containing protein [Dehalococcoidia bacterium]|nr:SRPBCC domain-containing protein [Dehalococcoidia bacterium]
MSEQIERIVAASPDRVWELWTTAAGIEQWWAPDGFRTEVQQLDLIEGGELVYAMTATAPEQVAFMEQQGMPLTTESHKTFREIDAPRRLSYDSLVDFVPDHDPYQHLTVVDLEPHPDGTRVVMTIEPLHDEVWTERLRAGRVNELDNLTRLTRSS